MGQYNSTIITNAGQSMIAQAIAEGQAITITHAKTSSYQYPGGTNFQELTDLQEIQQTVLPSSAGVFNDTLIQVLISFSNESIMKAYLIQNVGLYARLENGEETMIALCTAVTPDQMPAYDNVAPSAFIYNIQITVSQAGSLTVQVNPAGTATVQQILDIQKEIGSLTDLNTTEKGSLVGAANELFERMPPKENILANANFTAGIVNTQGKSSYTTTVNGNKNLPLFDSWYTWEGSITKTIEIQNGYIVMTAGPGSIFQKLNENKLISGKKYLLTMISEEGTESVFVTGGKDSGNDRFGYQAENEVNGSNIYINCEVNQKIYGIKLEEGETFTGMPVWNEAEERIRCGLDASDTGWIPLPLASGITNGDENPMYTPQYRKVGQTVYVHGLIKGVTTTGPNAALATLPDGYRPRNYRPKFVTWGERSTTADTSTLAAFRIYDSGIITMMNCAEEPAADKVYTLNFSFVI